MSAAHESSKPPRQVGVYRLDAKIGTGAMGTVYRATHMNLGKEVALKIVHAEDPEGEICRRFLREGIAASRVRHPNVVEVLDAGRSGDTAYLAMQLLEGETLAECLSRQGRLPVTYAVDLILPVCAALMAAHQAGVLHRDLKPANIFLTDVGRGEPEPMLLDFGISKILGPVDALLTQNPRFLGTPLYIAPEQADGAPGSDFSDQYSLALSLYECLLGVRPYEKYASSLIQLLRRVAEGEIRPARELDAGIPEELDEALCRALSVNPLERFPSMREFGAALLPFASAARATLWQHSFIDAERTMTSVNSPVSNSRSSRRVHVSVDDGARISSPPHGVPSTQRRDSQDPTDEEAEDDDAFISHSAMFGASSVESGTDSELYDSRDARHDSRDARLRRMERSSISRRSLPRTQKEESHDPYSQLPSGRPTSESWSGHSHHSLESDQNRTSYAPERNSLGVPIPTSWRSPPAAISNFAWFFSGVLVLATVFAAVTLIRFDLNKSQPEVHYPVNVESIPRSAHIYLDGLQVGTGSFRAKFAQDGALHRIRVSHPDYEDMVIAFQDEAPQRSFQLEPLARKPAVAGINGEELPRASAVRLLRAPAAKIRIETAPSTEDKRSAQIGSTKSGVGTMLPIVSKTTIAPQNSSTAQVPAASSVAEPAARTTTETKSLPGPAPVISQKKPVTPPEKKETSIQTGNLDPWAP